MRVHVDRVFELADGAAAHRLIEQGHTRGKIVLRISDVPLTTAGGAVTGSTVSGSDPGDADGQGSAAAGPRA